MRKAFDFVMSKLDNKVENVNNKFQKIKLTREKI